MAISMTGFGRGENKTEGYYFTVETKTINHRYLDLNIKTPRRISFLEEKIRSFAKDYVKRGRLDMYIKMDLLGKSDTKLYLDIELAKNYLEVLRDIRKNLLVEDDISVMNIAKFPEVVRMAEKEEDEDALWEALKPALESSLKNLVEMRTIEGNKLQADINERCDLLLNYLEKVEAISDRVPTEYRNKLQARIDEVLKDSGLLADESKILQEVAFFVDRSNITEEIVRFKSHVGQLRNTLGEKETTGRKIDFLIQEMNREVNTIGSKSSDLEITRIVVDLKSELEKIREQIQNIE